MLGKLLKSSLILSGTLILFLLGAGLFNLAAGAKDRPASIHQYIGSQACIGCHLEKFESWEKTGHSHMMTPIVRGSDFPVDPKLATPALKAELDRAQYMIAGQRFIARDPASGELKYLNVQYDSAVGMYKEYKGGSSWETGCAGCHTTGWAKSDKVFNEAGIGCESCHGPGREHVLNRGDRSKIIRTFSADMCGSCHVGGAMESGQRWPEGYKPGMSLSEIHGFKVTAVDPNAPPPAASLHLRQFAPGKASGHFDAADRPESTGHERDSCYVCHSAEARVAAEKGQPIKDVAFLKMTTDGVSCVACHDPHKDRGFPAQLRMSPAALCMDCHNASIPLGKTAAAGSEVHHPMKEMFLGWGALEVPYTKGVHTRDDVTCVDCHMTEGNHKFGVIMPSAVQGTTRKDSCVACHEGSLAEIRGAYLDMWQKMASDKVAALQPRIDAAAAKVKANPNLPAATLERFNVAKTNLSFVVADKSHGAHNFEYAMKILGSVEKAIKEFEAAAP